MVMKVQIKVDKNEARTEMLGEGTQQELHQVLVQLEILKFKLVRVLENETGGAEFFARANDGKFDDDFGGA